MRIPVTMCHGANRNHEPPLDAGRFANYFRIASAAGFESVSYDDLAAWRGGERDLPARSVMFDFDHPAVSIRHEIYPVMTEYGFRGNLFINTGLMEQMYSAPVPGPDARQCMTWDEIGELIDAGWLIGAHTHTHPDLSALCLKDPSGEALRDELVTCDDILKRELGITPRDFAFTGSTWSSQAEVEVSKRYRFGRLWIVGSEYMANGVPMRYADLVGVAGADEADGGPPFASRYITKESHPYRLPSMELESIIYEYEAFRSYLLGAL